MILKFLETRIKKQEIEFTISEFTAVFFPEVRAIISIVLKSFTVQQSFITNKSKRSV